jgi:hypothetical protein
LRACVGENRVERYFRSDGDVGVATELAITDLARFRAYIQAAQEALVADDVVLAIRHFTNAQALYGGSLLMDMPPCGYEVLAKAVDRSFASLQSRLIELRAAHADLSVVSRPFDDLQKLRVNE